MNKSEKIVAVLMIAVFLIGLGCVSAGAYVLSGIGAALIVGGMFIIGSFAFMLRLAVDS